jgi:hypothetical protein
VTQRKLSKALPCFAPQNQGRAKLALRGTLALKNKRMRSINKF